MFTTLVRIYRAPDKTGLDLGEKMCRSKSDPDSLKWYLCAKQIKLAKILQGFVKILTCNVTTLCTVPIAFHVLFSLMVSPVASLV